MAADPTRPATCIASISSTVGKACRACAACNACIDRGRAQTSAGFAAAFGTPFLSVVTAGIAIYLIIGGFSDIAQRVALRTTSLWSRLRGVPLSAWGTSIAHAGMGLTLKRVHVTGASAELAMATKLAAGYTKRYFLFYFMAACIYLVMTLASNFLIGKLEQRLRRGQPKLA